MGQIFIIEGPDGAGKTTLAHELKKHFLPFATYVHLGPPKPYEDVLHQYATVLYEASLNPRATIIDRLHIGESIYGPIIRGKDRLGAEGKTLIQRMISGYGAVEVLCLPDYAIAADNWRLNQGHEYVKKTDQYEKIYNGYAALVDEWPGIVYRYNEPQGISSSDIGRESVKPLPKGVIGSRNPAFLFVGDVANHETLDVPFMSLGGSSHFLYEHLQLARFLEHEIAFVNAISLTGEQNDVTSIWKELKYPVTICLGGNAKKAVAHPAVSIPHPAYWKRFKSGSYSHYTELLRVIKGNRVCL